jgi:flagellar basal-body rod protein FlgB
MPSHIEAVTTAALSAALETASRRQSAIAQNIANANSEGYVPLRLSFDAHLADAQATLQEKGRLDPDAVESLRAEAESVTGAAVRADDEMADLARNAVHFQALLQGLSRHLGLLAMAAADGRR